MARTRNIRANSKNIVFSFTMSKAFFWKAEIYINVIEAAIRTSSNGSKKELRRDKGAIACAAINLGLAAEYALKSIVLLHKDQVSREHKLWNLYRKIPDKVRIYLSSNYKKAIKNKPLIEIPLREENEIIQERNTSDLKSAIKASNSVFDDFRWYFEKEKGSDRQTVLYLGSLMYVIEILHFYLLQRTKERSNLRLYKEIEHGRFAKFSHSQDSYGVTPIYLCIENSSRLSDPARAILQAHKALAKENKTYDKRLLIVTVPCVVGCILAFETCVKCMLMALEVEHDNRTHDLRYLYNLLPSDIRNEINEKFEIYKSNNNNGIGLNILLTIGKNEEGVEKHAESQSNDGDNLQSVIDRLSNSFIEWRYFYQYDTSIVSVPLEAAVELSNILVLQSYKVCNVRRSN